MFSLKTGMSHCQTRHCEGIRYMEKDAYDYYIKANEQYNSGEIEDAIHLFLKSLEMDYHFKTYEKLYWCYNHLQQYDLANYFIKRAYEENSNNDKVAYLYAKVLIDKKQIDNAREILSSIIKRNPSYKKAKQEYLRLQEYGGVPMERGEGQEPDIQMPKRR